MRCLPSQPVRHGQLLCAGAHYQPWALPEVPHKAWHQKAITPLPLSDLAADSYVSTSAAHYVPKRSSHVRPTGGMLRPVVAAGGCSMRLKLALAMKHCQLRAAPYASPRCNYYQWLGPETDALPAASSCREQL